MNPRQLSKLLVSRLLGPQRTRKAKQIIEYGYLLLAIRQPPVLVYQMGKVGSQSVYYSLLDAGYFPVFHFHFVDHLKVQNNLRYRYLMQTFRAKKSVKIISLVREPVSRNLSAFAHDFWGCFGSRMQDYSVSQLESFFWQYDRHELGIQWFDTEFRKTTQVDIYQYSFDKRKGYTTIVERNLEVLVLKLEIPDNIKERIISDFVSLPEFYLHRYNSAASKQYKGNYDEFIGKINIPARYLDMLYDSKFSRHFYTEEELQQYREKWTRHKCETQNLLG